jgi:hypothetical protein
MKANCSLIDSCEREASTSTMVLEVARLHGVSIDRRSFSSDSVPADLAAAGSLIATTFDRLRHLSPAAQAHLKAEVARGATLYVKGPASPGLRCALAPFAEGQFLVSRPTIAAGYRMTDHPMLPGALRNEERPRPFATSIALGTPSGAQPLLLARGVDGIERPAIFAVRSGTGVVLYDLGPENSAGNVATLATLEDPTSLPWAVGTLAAARKAWKLRTEESQVNLVIDDRPANFDYFNCSQMLGFLRHLEHHCPGVHVDFAWTPDQSHPSRRYLAAMKEFRVGFVWHGLLRHVDHRSIADLSAEFAAGRRLVEQISAAYDVRFQSVMVFPFERATPRCDEFLHGHGFIAKAQTPPEPKPKAKANERDAMAAAAARPAPGATRKQFVVLERFPVERLTRDRMLARAALGLPIIAAAHPADLGLRRLAGIRPRARGSFAHFDPVLRFAAEKHLQPRSLEEIAFGRSLRDGFAEVSHG